jgi:hypothetical protein
VRARDAYGNSVESAPLSVTTPAVDDTVPPSTPTNLTLDFLTNQEEIWFSWTQSTDNVDPQSEILYDVYLNGVRRDWAAGGWTIVYCNPAGRAEHGHAPGRRHRRQPVRLQRPDRRSVLLAS